MFAGCGPSKSTSRDACCVHWKRGEVIFAGLLLDSNELLDLFSWVQQVLLAGYYLTYSTSTHSECFLM